MRNKKTFGYVLLVVGIAVLAVSLLADVLGIGGSGVFGFKQILGAVLGAAAIVGGVALAIPK